MSRKSIFDLFLALSIVIILLGIATIIFIQIDRGYVVSNTDNEAEFEAQQDRLVEYLYQSEHSLDKDVAAIAGKKPAFQQPVKPRVEPASVASRQVQTLKFDTREVSRQPAAASPEPHSQVFESFEEYELFLLSQNPWSPLYQPQAAQ